jgi:predicted AAA+ superfamily ATPase
MLNFTQLASDAEVPASTIREYYAILEDTLVGFSLEPWTRSKKRKAIQTAKFFFFDTGVTHTLAGTQVLDRNSNLYGASFEQFIGMEIRAFLDYRRKKDDLRYWRSTHGEEVDYLIGDRVAIEVKATKKVTPRDLRGLVALSEEAILGKYYLVTQDPIMKKQGDILCIPWRDFLKRLWDGEVI